MEGNINKYGQNLFVFCSIFTFYQYLPYCGGWETDCCGKLYISLALYLLTEWGTGRHWQCGRRLERKRLRYLIPGPTPVWLPQMDFIYQFAVLTFESPETRTFLRAKLILLDLLQEGEMPPHKVMESPVRKSRKQDRVLRPGLSGFEGGLCASHALAKIRPGGCQRRLRTPHSAGFSAPG